MAGFSEPLLPLLLLVQHVYSLAKFRVLWRQCSGSTGRCFCRIKATGAVCGDL